MNDEEGFLAGIRVNPDEDLRRLVYADWLDERDDPRGAFVRFHVALRAAAPDHPDRVAAERELSRLRIGCDPAWLAVIEPERFRPGNEAWCRCFDAGYKGKGRNWPTPYFHTDSQDTECDPWKRLLDLVEEAARDGREEFAPIRGLPVEDRVRIVTLPATIGRLKAVKSLHLYGSHLVRLPAEIGDMTSLVTFTPYTSYNLHWFPFELTRCRNLRDSTVSTRAIYGNFKYRPPFPSLQPGAEVSPGRPETARLPVSSLSGPANRPCSVCGTEYEDRRLHRVWVSLNVATDVLPLLVNACSEACVASLPRGAEGYVREPHRGGPGVVQPKASDFYAGEP